MSARFRQSKRARAIAKRPDVAAWVAELERVLQSAPHDVWLYAASSELEVMALGENGRPVVAPIGCDEDGGVRQSEHVATPDRGARRVLIDGGDW